MNIESINKKGILKNSPPTLVRQQIINLRKASPCINCRQIGDKVGVSRERVRQILSQNNLQTKRFKPPKPKVQCLNCGKPTTHKQFCSIQCGKDYKQISVECSECGRIFQISKNELIHRIKRHKIDEIFCNKQCYGRYMGIHKAKANYKILSSLSKIVEINFRDLINDQSN
jgi:aldehyde:ferredoxin oxidoreductase